MHVHEYPEPGAGTSEQVAPEFPEEVQALLAHPLVSEQPEDVVQDPELEQVTAEAVPDIPEPHVTVRVEPYVDEPEAIVYPVWVGEEEQLTIVQPLVDVQDSLDWHVRETAVPE